MKQQKMKFVAAVLLSLLAGLAGGFAVNTLCRQQGFDDSPTAVWLSCVVVAVVVFSLAIILVVFACRQKPEQIPAVTWQKKDTVLSAGKTYSVHKKAVVKPGQYTILAVDTANATMAVRVNEFVREFKHGDTIILAENDTIAPRSGNVILR